jgi:hypothetical protein
VRNAAKLPGEFASASDMQRGFGTKDTARKGVESGNINEFFLVLTK